MIMTYGELKKTEMYLEAPNTKLCINGDNEPVDESCYPTELDHLDVIGTGVSKDGSLLIDVICENWEGRHEDGWIAK